MINKIMILAGGGGHTGYASILAEELENKAELYFLAPDDDPLSVSRLESYGQVLTITKPRHPTTPVWIFIFRLMKAFYQSLSKITRKYDVVVSTGSNFCVPPALVAWMKGIPLVNLESRVRIVSPSKTAWILQYFARITVLQWEEQNRFLKGTVFGPLLPKKRVAPWNGGYVLVTGGTYGYKELFDAVSESNLENIVVQTGNLDSSVYKQRHPKWEVISFTDRFDKLLAGAEVVVCPPGGTPVEAVTYGKPVVIVRYPSWTKAASAEDVRAFAEKLNASYLVSISSSNIIAAIKEAKGKKSPSFKNGTKDLANKILSLC